MADNTSYMLQASTALKGACGEFRQAGAAAFRTASTLKDEALANLEATKGHLRTAQELQGAVSQLQAAADGLPNAAGATLADVQALFGGEAGLTVEGVLGELGGFATSLLMGVVDQIQNLVPPLKPLVLDPPASLDLEDLAALKDHVVDEASPYNPPTSEGAQRALVSPLVAPKSILEAPPEPTPAALNNALGTIDTTGLSFKSAAYPDGEIPRPTF